MREITRGDIKGPAIYEGMRDDFRKRMIELKRPRRIDVGDRVFLVFENRHTLIYQIEEMLRTEKLTGEPQIADEIEVYNALMPTDDSLSATLFLAVPPEADARTELDRLIGLDEHLVLHIGDHAVRAAFEAGRSTGDRISAVQYTRFPLPAEAKQALLTPGTPLAIEIDHPHYSHVTQCNEALRESLAADYERA
ncbi:MAG TPA: DUF3501 family protein [Kofleriaceae bacterium]|nr:DUF3501 family protein [Kofleriaceae bacterium]